METPTSISSLPDNILCKILLWQQPVPVKSDSDALWDSLRSISAYYILRTRSDDLRRKDTTYLIPPPPFFADPSRALLVASVCRRWRRLAQRSVSSLHIKDLRRHVSREDLAVAVACFPNLTHLHLTHGSVGALDDSFLAHVAASCPQLTTLQVGCSPERHLITESGLDQLFRHCLKLERLSLRGYERELRLPPSFFQLTRLHTLVLPGLPATETYKLANVCSLTVSSHLFPQQLSGFASLSRLSSLTLSSEDNTFGNAEHFAASSMPWLSSLTSLEFREGSPRFDLLFPSGSLFSSMERLLLEGCSQLEKLPDDIGNILPSLRELSIKSCTPLSQLPEEFTSLSRLTSLIISSCNQFFNLPENFGRLPALRSLALERLPLSDLPASLCQLTTLETLFLIDCEGIRWLPGGFCRLQSLKTLCIKRLPDLELPASIGGLSNLETFLLDSNSSHALLPLFFSELSSLTRLELNYCMIEELPSPMGRLRSLQELNICSCKCPELPSSFTDLTSLKILRIHDCAQLSSFPSLLNAFQRLQSFTLSRSFHNLPPLTEIPLRFDGLTTLTTLKLFGCHPSVRIRGQLPSSLEVLTLGNYVADTPLPDISQMPKLRYLSLLRPGIEPGEVGPLGGGRVFSHLKQLDLTLSFGMDSLPLDLASFPELRELRISARALREFPEAVLQLQKLRELDFSANGLTSLPEGIGALTELRRLKLSWCLALHKLPASLTQLVFLEALVGDYTRIGSLPPGDLPRLRSTSFQGFDC